MTKYTVIFAAFLFIAFACEPEEEEEKKPATRTYRMGFQNSAPHLTFEEAIQTLNMWIPRADAAIISTDVPWDSLFEGKKAERYVINQFQGLVNGYHSKNLELWIYIDPTNGLDRASESPALIKRGKSMTQADVQAYYKRFAFVMDSVLRPAHIGLVLETNLIRGLASTSLYNSIKQAANDAATMIRAYDHNVKLGVGVQVDWAWGRITSTPQAYQGVAQDFIDFPFIEELGLSSYPYFGFDSPADIPLDYYSKLVAGKNIPVYVYEGGWSSVTVGNFTGSEQKQADYFVRQRQLLDHAKAIGLFQLTFTDSDVSSFPGAPESLHLFAHLGLVDVNLQAKPALEKWDDIFKLKRVE